MPTREEIKVGLARRAYVWDKMRGEALSFEPFDKLSEEEQKAYYVLAELLTIGLHSQGVVIKVKRELPEWVKSEYWNARSGNVYAGSQQEMLNAGYVAVEPLIKEIRCVKDV